MSFLGGFNFSPRNNGPAPESVARDDPAPPSWQWHAQEAVVQYAGDIHDRVCKTLRTVERCCAIFLACVVFTMSVCLTVWLLS